MATETGEETPGVARDLPSLLSAWERLDVEAGGQIVFVAGGPGSGRSELLKAFTEELRRRTARPTVVAGAFTAGRFAASSAEPVPRRVTSILDRLLGLGGAAALVADGVVPYAGLLAQVLSKSQAAVELAESVLGSGDYGELPMLLPRVLRRLCEDKGPVACIVDNADDAPSGWWADLVLLFGRSIVRDLPLFLLMGLDGPRVLGRHEDDEPSVLFSGRQLVSAGLASWEPVDPLIIADLERWTGPAMPEVLRALLDVTGGRSGWAGQLWRDWKRRGVVDQTSEDLRWRFIDRARALDSVEDLLGERLKRRIGPSDPLHWIRPIESWLALLSRDSGLLQRPSRSRLASRAMNS